MLQLVVTMAKPLTVVLAQNSGEIVARNVGRGCGCFLFLAIALGVIWVALVLIRKLRR